MFGIVVKRRERGGADHRLKQVGVSFSLIKTSLTCEVFTSRQNWTLGGSLSENGISSQSFSMPRARGWHSGTKGPTAHIDTTTYQTPSAADFRSKGILFTLTTFR